MRRSVQNKKEDRLLNIFPFMDEINYSTYEEFIHTVKKKRNEMLIPDKKYISMESVHIDLSKIRELPVGKFHTVFQGIHLDCLAFVKKESPLYIMLSGDVGTLKKSEPGFYRWSYYKYCSGSVLCIADPMISIYDNLRLGWYYGNSAVNFRKLIAEFVKVVADFLRVEHEDIIFSVLLLVERQRLNAHLIFQAQRPWQLIHRLFWRSIIMHRNLAKLQETI